MLSKTIEQILYADVYVVDHYRNGLKRKLHNLTHKDKIPKHFVRITKISENDPTHKIWNDHLKKSGKSANGIYLHRDLKQAYDSNNNPVKPTVHNLLKETEGIDGGKNRTRAVYSGHPFYKNVGKTIRNGKGGQVHIV